MNRKLAQAFPDAHCELDFTTPLELAVATILSAQSTDKRVNLTTPALFLRYRTALDYAQADRVIDSLEVTVDRYGYREYYNPLTGRGLAARDFGFSTLLIDVLAQCGIDPEQPSAVRRMMRT